MKLYRAIEFSKLAFMLSPYGREEWNQCNEEFISRKLEGKNWWLHSYFESRIKDLIADVVANGHKNFFQKSLTYNSISGGRFNPSNSFGILYTSTNPAVAILEVLFHIFDSKKKFLKSANTNKAVYSDLFNEDHPSIAKHLIIVFGFEVQGENPGDFRDDKSISGLCERIGFDRYTADASFDGDFIFGNSYEISRLVGTFLNTREDFNCYRFRSARIIDEEHYRDFYNLIVPEKFIEDLNPRLSGQYFISETGINIADHEGHHEISIRVKGQEDKDFLLKLEKAPDKRGGRDLRYKTYRPILPEEFQPNLNTRYVIHQRFKNKTR